MRSLNKESFKWWSFKWCWF